MARIESAIEACYDAVFDSQRWPGALQQLADSLGATSCVIRTWDETHPFAADRRQKSGWAPDLIEHAEFTALWLERIEGAPDPHLDRPRLLAKPATSFIVEDEITTREEREVLPYYQEIARPGHREWYAAVEFSVRNLRWSLALFREAGKGPFDPRQASQFLRVAPHLSRIINAAERLWDVSVGRSLDALSQLGSAAVLLDRRGSVRQLNKHAEDLFGSDLLVRHSRIRATDRASDARLQRLVTTAIRGRSDWSVCADPIVIARSGRPWLLVEVMPMTSFGHDLFNGGDTLLYFTDLVDGLVPSERLLMELFGLTKAEARVAGGVAAGGGVSPASARLGISRETARTQLRAVFEKTGTHSQAELAAMFSRLRKPSQH